ncbi:restriction endonuclease subunit S [Companilactobacillus futsaii]|uniref:restriction endonuclease subunit S n=1 Tax=Companilactobacillus futsaii TaxID=938155 RepID=UPI00189CAFE8|nr:restriction endonuclease subunit S [Companilactobacillus futsaii]
MYITDWEQHSFQNTLIIHSGKDYKHLNKGNIPVYGTGGYMLSVDEKLSKVDGIGLGRKGTIDKPQYLKAPFWTVDTLFYMTPKSNFEILFLYAIVQKFNWKKLNEASGVPSLSKKTIEKVMQFYPTQLEQKKLGYLLKIIAETIALQQQQLNLYIKLKKGLLQKLFPKNGEMVPEIRFADFTGDWEQRKSGEIFSSTSKKGYPELPVLSVTQDHGVVKRENLNIDIKYDKTTLKNYKLVSNGDFIISLRSFQGGFELSRTRGIVSPAYTVFEFKNPREHNHEFWKNWFKTFKFIQSLKTITFGIRDGKSISFSEFKSLRNTFPADVKEQEQIGNLLEKIDSVINLQHEQLNKLESLKKYLLQKLFI